MAFGRFFWISYLACGLLLAASGGCVAPTSGGREGAAVPSRLSLIDIGERAMETGERLEDEELHLGALEAYRRALWAFEYHYRLTGREPLFLVEARESVARMEGGAPILETTKQVEPSPVSR